MRAKPMMLSELVERLSGFLENVGDMPVYLYDADTGWEWKAKPGHFRIEGRELIVGGDYDDERRDPATQQETTNGL